VHDSDDGGDDNDDDDYNNNSNNNQDIYIYMLHLSWQNYKTCTTPNFTKYNKSQEKYA
jgi:hypothetical protein